MQPFPLHGFYTKTITFPTEAGLLNYNLGDYQQDNFGENGHIVGLSIRRNRNVFGATSRSINDRELLNEIAVENGYINLVKWGPKKENIWYKKNLSTLIREAVQVDNGYALFFPPTRINWEQSNIFFTSNTTLTNDEDVELTVYYSYPDLPEIYPTIQLDTKVVYPAFNQFNVEVKTTSDQTIFQINGGRSPLNSAATIVGMRINNIDFTAPSGNTGIDDTTYLEASFLTMRIGNLVLIDECSLINIYPFEYTNIPFFPLPPTLAKDFDWSKCQIEVSDKSIPLDDYSYLITLFYTNDRSC